MDHSAQPILRNARRIVRTYTSGRAEPRAVTLRQNAQVWTRRNVQHSFGRDDAATQQTRSSLPKWRTSLHPWHTFVYDGSIGREYYVVKLLQLQIIVVVWGQQKRTLGPSFTVEKVLIRGVYVASQVVATHREMHLVSEEWFREPCHCVRPFIRRDTNFRNAVPADGLWGQSSPLSDADWGLLWNLSLYCVIIIMMIIIMFVCVIMQSTQIVTVCTNFTLVSSPSPALMAVTLLLACGVGRVEPAASNVAVRLCLSCCCCDASV